MARLLTERRLFYLLSACALVYAFAAGLKTLTTFDLGWLMATGRWIVQHHQIPSTDVFSYTAQGQPWIYPVGSSLVFYGAYLVGGYALLSWLVAAACLATVALLLRRGSAISAALTLFAVPLIAERTTGRAEMFTGVLFAATLTLLWEQHETGRARLWLLPVLMAAWVNLHPGFISGLGLLGVYLMLEAAAMLRAETRSGASARLRRCTPWLLASCAATLVNPWGWGVYQVIARQQAAMAVHSQLISEWAPMPLNTLQIGWGLALSNPFYVLVLAAGATALIALVRRRWVEALVLAGALLAALQHERLEGLFACLLVVAGGAVLTPLAPILWRTLPVPSLRLAAAAAASLAFVCWTGNRVSERITNRYYLSGTYTDEFGAGLSWWFPQGAADFVEANNLPSRIFSSNSEGAYLAFRLGPKYQDYIDGRAIPFGKDLMLRAEQLKASPPDAPVWREETERYGINTIVIPLGRYDTHFPALRQFCESASWTPVYLDEVSVVFVRNTPETEALTSRLRIRCATAPVPAGTFQQAANAASVLYALGRNSDAFAAAGQALALFPESGYLHFLRGHILQDNGQPAAAEPEYLLAAKFAPDMVAPWTALAAYDEKQGRFADAVRNWQAAANVSRRPWQPLESLGYADLQAHRPQDALDAFNKAAAAVPDQSDLLIDNNFLANIAHGRARAYYRLGDLSRAISYESEAARLLPGSADLWQQLAALYDAAGQHAAAVGIRQRFNP